MTEDEWLQCADWQPMLEYLAGRIGKRKGKLYVCAGLRLIWNLLYDDASRKAVEIVERDADGSATNDEIGHANWAAECPTFGYDFDPQFLRQHMGNGDYSPGVHRLLEMGVYREADIRQKEERLGDEAVFLRLSNAAHIAYHCTYLIDDKGLDEHLMEHLAMQEEWPGGWLVREIFGNPFRQVVVAPEYQTETIISFARGVYAERAFDRLPILADMLEEVGCYEAELLAHCRGQAPHVLGCWSLDIVLNKL